MSMSAAIPYRSHQRRTITFKERLQGPPSMANGGLIAGTLASLMPGPVEVTLRHPAPLDRPVTLEREGDFVTLSDDDLRLAEGRPAERPELVNLPQVSLAEAHAASARFGLADAHPFPHCFVCGTARQHGDALRLIAGPLATGDGVAAPFSPGPEVCEAAWRMMPSASQEGTDKQLVPELLLWAALDCPGAWSLMLAPGAEPAPMVLGRIRGQVLRQPALGEPMIVVGRPRGQERRKHFCETAVLSIDGELLACAESIWIALT